MLLHHDDDSTGGSDDGTDDPGYAMDKGKFLLQIYAFISLNFQS